MSDIVRIASLLFLGINQVHSQCYTPTVSSQARNRIYGPLEVSSQSECEQACNCASGFTSDSSCSSFSPKLPARSCLAYSFDSSALKCSLLGDTLDNMCAEPASIFLLESCVTMSPTEISTSISLTMTTTIDPCSTVTCTHGTCTAIFSASDCLAN